MAHYARVFCRGRIGARHSPRPLIGGHEENSGNARTNAAARLICMSGGSRRASADKNRNDGDVLVICPTCQTGSLKASMPAALFYFAWGCFRYFGFGWTKAPLAAVPTMHRPAKWWVRFRLPPSLCELWRTQSLFELRRKLCPPYAAMPVFRLFPMPSGRLPAKRRPNLRRQNKSDSAASVVELSSPAKAGDPVSAGDYRMPRFRLCGA